VESLPLNLAEAEEILIKRALNETGGNIASAARMLGVHRTRIYRTLALEGTTSPQEARVASSVSPATLGTHRA
jgi:DNA-binding NtrC family response regulator